MIWRDFIAREEQKPYFTTIIDGLCADMLEEKEICPVSHSMYRIFGAVPYDDVRVVVLGQDPYYANPNEANGFAFAVGQEVKIPSSLRNIFKEIASDIGEGMPTDKTLEYLVAQGVFLLNTALTTRLGQAFAHGDLWQPFTDNVISFLNARQEPIVFMLWGSKAKKKKELITGKHHYILEAAHPSGLSAHRGFFGCRHFSKANAILKKIGKEPVNWGGQDEDILVLQEKVSTEDKQTWCDHGVKLENRFVADIAPLLAGVSVKTNPEKETDKYAPDILMDGQLADLKTQNTPFFKAEIFYNIPPQWAVTFNGKDYKRYTELYPGIKILFWCQWKQVEYVDKSTGEILKVDAMNGVWETNMEQIQGFIDGGAPNHRYINRRNDTKGNAKDSYCFDLRKMKKLWMK